jgi:hypothetical protein
MALHLSRYSKIYSKIHRPDVAQAFPRNVFLREPNTPSRKETATGNTFVHQ